MQRYYFCQTPNSPCILSFLTGKIFVCEDHPSQTPEGVSQAIQWKDPDEEEEMKILQQRLAMETQAMANATESEGRGDVAAHGQVHSGT